MVQVNRSRMKNLMEAFYALTGIRIVLFDSDFLEIMSVPANHCSFCRTMREKPQFLQRCIKSDQTAFFQCKKTNKPFIYECHAGLTEAVIQLCEENAVLGYIMFGQVIPKNNTVYAHGKLAQICVDNGEMQLLEDVFNMTAKSPDEIHAASIILQAISVYAWSDRVVTLPKSSFSEILNEYIDDHLRETIIAQDVAAFFGIGKTNLYKLCVQHLEHTLSEHIKKRRLTAAQKLLVETNMTISEIAEQTGFTDYNYFSKCFKAEMGISAREYRLQKSIDCNP